MLEVEFKVEGRKNLALKNSIRSGSLMENTFWRLPGIILERTHPPIRATDAIDNTRDTDVVFFILTNFFFTGSFSAGSHCTHPLFAAALRVSSWAFKFLWVI